MKKTSHLFSKVLSASPFLLGQHRMRKMDDTKPSSSGGTNSSSGSCSGQGNRQEIQHNVRAVPGAASAVAPRRSASSTPGRRRTFPFRLHALLSDVEQSGQTDIISWQPHGRCFIVRNTDAFVEKLLPRYFNQTKWSSFQRQLNLYSFERISAGMDRGGYYHKFFLRGEPALVDSITRSQVKGTKIRVPSDARNEPNFYMLPAVNPPAPDPLTDLGQLFYPSVLTHAPPLANPSTSLTQSMGGTTTPVPSNSATDALWLQSLALANQQHPTGLGNYNANQALLMSQARLVSDSSAPTQVSNVERMRQLTGGTNRPSITAPPAANNVNWDLVDRILASIPNDLPPNNIAAPLPNMSAPRAAQNGTIPVRRGVQVSSGTTEATDGIHDSKPAAIDGINSGNASSGDVAALRLSRAANGTIVSGVPAAAASVASGEHANPTTAVGTIHPTASDTPSVFGSTGNTIPGGEVDESSTEWGTFINRYFD